MGEETVLADSGRAGEIVARVGRVRSLAFLSVLRESPLSGSCLQLGFSECPPVFQ